VIPTTLEHSIRVSIWSRSEASAASLSFDSAELLAYEPGLSGCHSDS
jgi:hypothetical protein